MNKLFVMIPVAALILSVSITYVYAQNEPLPTWIKNSAGYWANDEVSDTEFLSLIQFLIDKKIITVPDTRQDNSEQIDKLKKELSQIKKDSLKDIQGAFDDGYDKGISTNANAGTVVYSCDDSLEQKLLVGFAQIGILESYDYIPFDNSPSSYYWEDQLVQYQSITLDDLAGYPTDCSGTATDDEKYLLGWISFLIDLDLTAEELCNNISEDDESYQECYDLFKPIE